MMCLYVYIEFLSNTKNVYESVTNNCTKLERVLFSYRGTFLMHINKMIYNNYHYLELCVIIHAWLLLVEVFFKGVHLECEKKPIHIIHFIGYLSAKYLPLFSN